MKEELKKVHPYEIFFSEKDKRWKTNVINPETHKRQVKAKKKEEDLYDILFEFYGIAAVEDMTMKKLYPEWIEFKKLHVSSGGTVSRNASDWKKYYVDSDIVDIPLKKLTKVRLDKWAHKLVRDNEMTGRCYSNVRSIINQMLDYAVDLELISANPMHSVKIDKKLFRKVKKKPAETQVYNSDEEQALIQLAWDDFSNRNYTKFTLVPLAAIFQFQTGVRVGELLILRYSDIEGNYLHVQRMIERDTGKILDRTKSDQGDRRIYLTSLAKEVITAAKDYQREHGYRTDGYIFGLNDVIPNYGCFDGMLEKYCKKLGICRKSSHKVRKTYCSVLLSNGVNLDTVREMAGHAESRTTLNCYVFDPTMPEERQKMIESALCG